MEIRTNSRLRKLKLKKKSLVRRLHVYFPFLFIVFFSYFLSFKRMEIGTNVKKDEKKVTANLMHKNIWIVYFCDSCRRSKLNFSIPILSFICHVEMQSKYHVLRMCELARYDSSTIFFLSFFQLHRHNWSEYLSIEQKISQWIGTWIVSAWWKCIFSILL